MLLSVVIPVYNAENFLRETVSSVVNQDFSDFEIILVNDGSTDGSAQLCDVLARKKSNIRVIHKNNGGVSSARNAGIEAAKGKYITFIDSDDKVAQHMFSDMLKECQTANADKVFCALDEISPDGTHSTRISDLPARQVLNRQFIVSEMLFIGCMRDSYMNTVCGSLFKTELIDRYKLKFENRSMGEDWLFNMQYCDICQSVVYIDNPYYIYMRNNGSAMSRYHRRQFEFWIENRQLRKSLANKYKFDLNQQQTDALWMSKVMFYAIKVINNDVNSHGRLIEIFNNNEFVSALNNSPNVLPKFFKPVVWLLKKRLNLLAEMLLRIYSLRIKS